MMTYIFLFVTAVPVFALAFTAVTCFLGVFIEYARPQEATLYELYRGFLIIAAILLIVGYIEFELMSARPAINGTLTFIAVSAAFRRIFNATWLHALVIGVIGGFLGTYVWVLFLEAFV